MQRMLKLLDDHFEEAIIFVALSAMSLIIAFQVLMRYGFDASLSWSEEISRYLFIWLIYIGISYGVKKQAHVAVTALDLWLSPRQIQILRLLSAVVFLVFAILIFYYGREVCSKIGRLGQQSPAMDIPMWMVYAAVPTGFGLTCIRLVQLIYRQLKDWNKPVEPPQPSGNSDPILL